MPALADFDVVVVVIDSFDHVWGLVTNDGKLLD